MRFACRSLSLCVVDREVGKGLIKAAALLADDRNGRQASRIAQKFNEQLESYWCSLAHGLGKHATQARAIRSHATHV
jgi:hypothetical protein